MRELPPHGEMVDNIIRTCWEAERCDLDSGLDWYPNTRRYIQGVADEYGYPLRNAVGAYAVLSPSLTKELNDKVIVTACKWHSMRVPVEYWPKIGTYGMPNRIKAARCLDGDLTAVGGDKVSRFYRNLMGEADHEVTVDRWAIRIALDDPKIEIVGGKSRYNAIADAYIEASTILGVEPLQCQAVSWEVFRRRYFKPSADLYKGVKAA